MEHRSKSDQELKKVFFQKSAPNGWDESVWKNEREHAFGEFWRRRLSNSREVLSSSQIENLLSYAELDTALGAIGDAAMLNLIDYKQCNDIINREDIDIYPKAEWVKREIGLRIRVYQFRSEENPEFRYKLLDELLHQRRSWPVENLIQDFSPEELDFVEESLNDRSVLTRAGREGIRQSIRNRRRKENVGAGPVGAGPGADS